MLNFKEVAVLLVLVDIDLPILLQDMGEVKAELLLLPPLEDLMDHPHHPENHMVMTSL